MIKLMGLHERQPESGNQFLPKNIVFKGAGMTTIAELPEIVQGKIAAQALGVSVWWLWRRWRRLNLPLYAPNAAGAYSRRQVELIAEVEAGVHDAEQAYRILQAEHDAKRAQGAVAIANAKKRKNAARRREAVA